MTRRELLLTAAAGTSISAISANRLNRKTFQLVTGRVVLADENESTEEIHLHVQWNGDVCQSSVVNGGRRAVRIKELVLFSIRHSLAQETSFYGEGFTMLSETAGTLAKPESLSPYTDAKHYRIPEPPDAKAYYGMVMLSPMGADRILLAFTSCNRFSGKFYVRNGLIDAVVDTEGLELGVGAEWKLEELICRTSPDRTKLLDMLAKQISKNHAPQLPPKPPTGWCSWYMLAPKNRIVGADITAAQVLRNLDFMAAQLPQLRYVQIDDGYSSTEGDWLSKGNAFNGDVKGVLKQIRDRGFEPAIWVAPFIAEQGSAVFKDHPDWFVKDEDGKPLRSDLVTFGGWHRGPWYALDGTNPKAQKHLEQVFGVLRREWGCTYFKLDANFWGAIHKGRHYDPKATRVEAYRRGMQAIRRGAGEGAFILGCNHPLWPSLGLISGSRSSNDTGREWSTFKETARENLLRGWQNGKLWWNDPDCVLLTGDLPESEYRFHATAIYASGGAVLSGDDLPSLSPKRLEMLRKLLPPTGIAATFENDSLSTGWIRARERTMVCFFNWTDEPQSFSLKLQRRTRILDFWDDVDLGLREKSFEAANVPPRAAKLLVLT